MMINAKPLTGICKHMTSRLFFPNQIMGLLALESHPVELINTENSRIEKQPRKARIRNTPPLHRYELDPIEHSPKNNAPSTRRAVPRTRMPQAAVLCSETAFSIS